MCGPLSPDTSNLRLVTPPGTTVSDSSFPRHTDNCAALGHSLTLSVTEEPLPFVRSKNKTGSGMTAPGGTWPWQLQMYTGNISYPQVRAFSRPYPLSAV